MECVLKDRNGNVVHKVTPSSQDKPDVIHWRGEYYVWEEENVYVEAIVYYERELGKPKPIAST